MSVADFQAVLCSQSLIIMCKPGCSKCKHVGQRPAKLQRQKKNENALMLSSASGKTWLARLAPCMGWALGLWVHSSFELQDTKHTSRSSLLLHVLLSHCFSVHILHFTLMGIFVLLPHPVLSNQQNLRRHKDCTIKWHRLCL